MLRIIRRSLAGHSKWANIRHKKGGKDAAKADQFQKLAKVIETSSRLAGGDRSHPALASALSRAKDARMPKKTVDAAVSRGGADKTAGAGLEELVYEGSLPGGVGVIVDALSDNKNRTAGEVRATFKKHGGALGAPGSCAAWTSALSPPVVRRRQLPVCAGRTGMRVMEVTTPLETSGLRSSRH